MSHVPFHRYHWQQGPPPFYPGFFNHQMMEYNNRRPIGFPGPLHNYHNRRSFGRGIHHHQRTQNCDSEEYVCFICKDNLQNCEDQGIHLCDGGRSEDKKEEFVYIVEKENIDARLEKLVSEIKGCLQNKYESVTESLENYVSNRVNEINNINKELIDEREHLEKLKKELEVRGAELQNKEKELIDQEKKFDKHQQKSKRELLKEKEEILRQWQQLRDEITRMEELHKVQKVVHTSSVLHLQVL